MRLRFLLFLFLITGLFMRAMPHEEVSVQDTIYQLHSDSLPHKTIAGKFIHQLLFSTKIPTVEYDQEYLERKVLPYQKMEGKIIRQIHISVIDPFGYSLLDTAIHPIRFTRKVGNAIHINTHQQVIKNLLLLRVHQSFDSLLYKESERLIRSQKYVQDVTTSTILSPSADSVDIFIRVIDIWSIIPTFRKTGYNYVAGLADNNLAGSGNRLHVDTRFGSNFNGLITQLGYTISNIGNTHISGSLQYYFEGGNDILNNPAIKSPLYTSFTYNLPTLTLRFPYLVKSVELYRPFFSPLTRWAGGIFLGQLPTRQNYIQSDSVKYHSSQTAILDYWAAISLPLYRNHSLAARTSSIIFSLRMLRTNYAERIAGTGNNSLFNDENFYFAGIGLTSRRFIQDRYVFNYGKIEDIPIGRSFGMTTGIHVQKTSLFYLGLKAALGNNYSFGYLSSHLEYGTFFSSKGLRQQVITGRVNYYTRLFNIGYWKLRQFIKPTVIIGLNRLPTDNLSLQDAMQGFDELNRPASKMLALTLQTQSYAPFEIYGFRLGPYFFSSWGILSADLPSVNGNRLYSALGLGVLLKNNYLLINTFQVSLTWYPFLPESGHNVINLNAYKTTDYGLSNFEISRPQVVETR